jgi:hypothetical protein
VKLTIQLHLMPMLGMGGVYLINYSSNNFTWQTAAQANEVKDSNEQYHCYYLSL